MQELFPLGAAFASGTQMLSREGQNCEISGPRVVRSVQGNVGEQNGPHRPCPSPLQRQFRSALGPRTETGLRKEARRKQGTKEKR